MNGAIKAYFCTISHEPFWNYRAGPVAFCTEFFHIKFFFVNTYPCIHGIIILVNPPNTLYSFLLHPIRTKNTFSKEKGSRSELAAFFDVWKQDYLSKYIFPMISAFFTGRHWHTSSVKYISDILSCVNGVHSGRPLPLGSPVLAKLVQYLIIFPDNS